MIMIKLDKLNEEHPIRIISIFSVWLLTKMILFFDKSHVWKDYDMSLGAFNRSASNLCLNFGFRISVSIIIIILQIILILGV